MDFEMKKKFDKKNNYESKEIEIVQKFAKKLEGELNDLLFSVVIFGSSVKNKNKESNDIDVFVILNDSEFSFNEEIVNSYQIILKKIISSVSSKLHVTSVRLTKFWKYVKDGDAVIINVLREGFPVYDRGIILPLKSMLFSGFIKPTPESVYVYHRRSKETLLDSRLNVLKAINDLYWSVIDSAHSILMSHNIIPPSPEHIAKYIKEYKDEIGLEDEYVRVVKLFYKIYKKIEHEKVKSFSGQDYDNLYEFANKFVKKVNELLSD